MNHFLKEENYNDFVDWAKGYEIVFRRDEVKRNDKPDATRYWKLLFALFLEANSDLS